VLEYVQPGECLVVWKLDRLGRSLSQLLKIVVDLQKRNVAFHSLTDQIDTSTPNGELLFSIFGALAQYESALVRVHILAGLESARTRGRKGGQPRAVDDEKITAIAHALQSVASKASVCRNFNIKRSALYDYLGRHSTDSDLHSIK
jgi:DNA invertase Pin-like site-specific DNA recombinase